MDFAGAGRRGWEATQKGQVRRVARSVTAGWRVESFGARAGGEEWAKNINRKNVLGLSAVLDQVHWQNPFHVLVHGR